MKDFNLENYPTTKTGFKIPDNYFETFSDQLMLKLPEKKVKTIAIFSKPKKWIYAVAAVLIISISVPIINNFASNASDIEDEKIETYLASSDFSDHDLSSLLDEKDLKAVKIDLEIEDQTIENELIKNNNIEQCLTQ